MTKKKMIPLVNKTKGIKSVTVGELTPELKKKLSNFNYYKN